MADTAPDVERAKKAALAAQVAKWKEKEAVRLEKRRRDKLAASQRNRSVSPRESSPRNQDIRNVGQQTGYFRRQNYTPEMPPVVQRESDILLFKPENLQALPDIFSEDQRRKWHTTLSAYWHTMNTNEPDSHMYRKARSEIEEFSSSLRTTIQQATQVVDTSSEPAQPSQHIQQMQQRLGFNARGSSVFNTRAGLQSNPAPPGPAEGTSRPTYTRMSRKYLSVETLVQRNVDFEYDEDPEFLLVKRWVPEPEQDLLWEHTRLLREGRRVRSRSPPRPELGPPYEEDYLALRDSLGGESPGQEALEELIIGRRLSDTSNPESLIENGNLVEAVEDHTDPNRGYTRFTKKRANVRAITDLGYTYRMRPDGTIMILKHLEKEQIDEVVHLSAKYNREAGEPASSGTGQNKDFITMRNIPVVERTGGGLLIENFTISRDNVIGQEARKAELLAQFGKKQFTLAFRTLTPRAEEELVEDKSTDRGLKPGSGSKSYERNASRTEKRIKSDSNGDSRSRSRNKR